MRSRSGDGWRSIDGPSRLVRNRSVCFTTDFPSGAELSRAAVRRAIVLHDGRLSSDLLSVLVGWRRAGLDVMESIGDARATPVRLGLASTIARALAWVEPLGLQRTDEGPFGKRVQAS